MKLRWRLKTGARVARPSPRRPKLMVAGGGVLSESVGDSAVTGPGFLLQEKNGETPAWKRL